MLQVLCHVEFCANRIAAELPWGRDAVGLVAGLAIVLVAGLALVLVIMLAIVLALVLDARLVVVLVAFVLATRLLVVLVAGLVVALSRQLPRPSQCERLSWLLQPALAHWAVTACTSSRPSTPAVLRSTQ